MWGRATLLLAPTYIIWNYDYLMPRNSRITPGGIVYHITNHRAESQTLFFDDADYHTFESALTDTAAKRPIRIIGYCLMPTHWHLLLWPEGKNDLGNFLQLLSLTHVARWKVAHQDHDGPLYQSRYRSFPVQDGKPCREVLQYIESNAKRAGRVRHAEDWPWSSLWIRDSNDPDYRSLILPSVRCPMPAVSNRNWTAFCNRPINADQLQELRTSAYRGRPYGDAAWVKKTARRLKLQSKLKPIGRPRKS